MGNTGYIRFGAAFSTNELGHLGFSAKGVPAMMYEGTVNTLLHSGNIGEYKAGGLAHSNGTIGAIINSSGNVTIGDQDLAGTSVKLFVSGDTRFDGQTRINGSMRFYGKSGISSDIYLNNQSVGGLLFTYSDKKPLLLVSSNIGIGTDNPQKKLHVVGDLYVEGNIIATKEVSAGGAGQEGESGDGGAEVIDKELAKGQSSYTIPNTIGRSAVAVSLYEWNANNGSWDMCLADISVKDATITVTFGSATSVNHKLVAVG